MGLSESVRRIGVEPKYGPGRRAAGYVSGELAPVRNVNDGRVLAERQLGDVLLSLREQGLGFLSEPPELGDAVCSVSELPTRVVLKANVRRQERKHAVNIEGVVGEQVTIYQLLIVWVAHSFSMHI